MKTKKVNKKQNLTMILAVVLVAALAIGGTLAYLTAISNEKENQFTFVTAGDDDDKDMTLKLYEPDWDGEHYDDNWTAPAVEDQGKTRATNILPGREIPKNPFLRNTSTIAVDEWVMLTYEYWIIGNADSAETANQTARLMTAAEVEALFEDGYITIDINTTDWNKIVDASQGEQAGSYMYTNKLAADTDTNPLFTKVTISNLAPNWFMDDIMEYGGFEIRLKGYAMQAEGVSSTDAEYEFKKLGNGSDDIFDDDNRY